MSLKYIDLFSGCGGLSFGLYNSNLKGIFAVEKNEDAFKTLKENLITHRNHFEWPSWLKIKNHDIFDLLNEEDKLLKLNGEVDLIVGGPPCQGFSMAGKRSKDDLRNTLSNAYIEFVSKILPKFILIENVVGYTIPFIGDSKSEAEEIERKLTKLGYNFTSKIINMSDYGVPQSRKRYIGYGVLNSKNNDFFNLLEETRRRFLLKNNLTKKQTVLDAISDLCKSQGKYKPINSNFFYGKYGQVNSNYQKLMRINNTNKYPDSHRFVNHRNSTKASFKLIQKLFEPGKRLNPKNNNIVKKRNVTYLNHNAPSGTITSIPDDYIHYKEPRVLTVREMARIQSFPDDYIFKGKYTTGGNLRRKDVPRYTQVANAVPPIFAEQIGLTIKEMSKNGKTTF